MFIHIASETIMAKKLRPEFLANHASVDLITVDEVAHLLGVTRCTVYRRMKQPTFPKPIKLSRMCTRFRLADVRAWINSLSPAPALAA